MCLIPSVSCDVDLKICRHEKIESEKCTHEDSFPPHDFMTKFTFHHNM